MKRARTWGLSHQSAIIDIKFINRLMMVSMRIARYILKAVEKVLHESLVYTFLEQNGLQGNLQNIVIDFLCQKTVVLNGQHSSLTNVEGGIPGDLFFGHSF